MSSLLFSICLAAAAIAALAKFFDLFFGRNKKEDFQNSIQSFQAHFTNAEPKTVVLFPMYLVAAFYNRLLGARIFSMTAFYRTVALTGCLGIWALGIAGIITGQPFAMKTAPWDFAEISVKIAQVEAVKIAALPKSADKILVEENIKWIQKLDGPIAKTLYTVFFFGVVILANSFLNFSTIAIVRLFLKEMLENKIGILPLFMMVAINFFVVICASALILLLLGVIATPAMWLVYAILFWASIKSPPIFMILGEMAISFAWGLCAIWMKISACVAIIPTAIVAVPVLLCGMGFRFRKKIHNGMVYSIARVLEHEKGVFAFVATVLTVISASIGLLIQALNHWLK